MAVQRAAGEGREAGIPRNGPLGEGMSTVVVFGGSGFLGQCLVDRLTAEGMTVCVAVRNPERARVALRAIDF